MFDTENFIEKDFLKITEEQSGNYILTMNWLVFHPPIYMNILNVHSRYNSFKVAALFCLGFHEAAAELGFMVYESRDKHPK